MKWIIALVLCFTFPWVGVPMLIWLLLPTLCYLVFIDRVLAAGTKIQHEREP